MTTFNFEASDEIYVDTSGDEVSIRFGSNHLFLKPTSSGFSATNDWNNRHFTLAFDENSLLYHVTREDIDDKQSGKKAVPPEEFVAELYTYIRSLAPAYPRDRLDFDFVGRLDMEAMKDFLRRNSIIEDSDDGVSVDNQRGVATAASVEEDPAALREFLQENLIDVSAERAFDPLSGENIYFYPSTKGVKILFVFPDDYVSVTTAAELFEFAENAGGSQIMNHVIRSVSTQ